MPEIRAVVSDFGGVLTSPLLTAFLALQDEHGISPDAFGAAMRALRKDGDEIPLHQLERGELSEVDFLAQLTGALEPVLGHRPELHQLGETMIGALDPNREMIELMAELRGSGLRMAMLTNNVREWESLWRAKLPVDEIFETVVDSAFVGCRKPEARIYELTLERIGIPAEHCLFVDDLEINCDGAREAGLNAVHFRDNEQAIPEIRAAIG